ncbi:MAG: cytochrome c oxidase subunit II [Chloroflexota bacterium]
MKVHSLEKIYLALCAVLIALGVAAVAASVFSHGIHLVGPAGAVNAVGIAKQAPFDQLGLRQTGDGQYDLTMLGQMWQWNPVKQQEPLAVPLGSTVTFRLTSSDVVHGIMVRNTDINAMLIPGQITQFSYTFDEPGEYLIVCHEYCGAFHHEMYGKLVVS